MRSGIEWLTGFEWMHITRVPGLHINVVLQTTLIGGLALAMSFIQCLAALHQWLDGLKRGPERPVNVIVVAGGDGQLVLLLEALGLSTLGAAVAPQNGEGVAD